MDESLDEIVLESEENFNKHDFDEKIKEKEKLIYEETILPYN